MALPVKFPEMNTTFAEDQKEYLPLPAFVDTDGRVVTCWELSEEEIMDIVKTKRVYLQQLTFKDPHQPVSIYTHYQNEEED